MRIAIHVTERVKHRWPAEYWGELVRKLTASGHDVLAFSDEPNVKIEDKNPRFFDRTGVSDSAAMHEIAKCDLFIGPVLKYHKMAITCNVRAIAILGPTLKAEGVKANIPCAGCEENAPETVDCFWNDELCQHHVTPNDILGVM